jgi:hypothetical protein
MDLNLNFDYIIDIPFALISRIYQLINITIKSKHNKNLKKAIPSKVNFKLNIDLSVESINLNNY